MRPLYLIASVAAHAALLSLMYYHGTYQPGVAAQAQLMAASRQMDSHAAMRGRVADMEHIKDLLRESVGELDGAAQEKVRFDATSTEETGELLAHAEALAKEIDAIGQRAWVDEYAKLAGVDKEQAARELAPPEQLPVSKPDGAQAPNAPQAPDAARPADGGAPGPAPANTEARIASLEQRARAVLAQRQQQMERAQQGVQVGNAPTAGQGAGQGRGQGQGQGQGQGLYAGGQGVAGRMEAFIKRDLGKLVPDRAGGYRGNDRLFHNGVGQMAGVDRSAMRKGSGRKLGAGGEFANRVYVNSWYLIGPFEGKHGAGMFANGSNPPEQAVVLDATYRGKGGRLLTWRYVESPSYPLVPPDQVEDSVYYGYTEVMMDSERDLSMWVGADDDVQVWLNDRLEWKGGNINKAWFFNQVFQTGNTYASAYNENEGKVRVRFRKGRNKLFFKLSNGPNQCFLSLVLTPL